MADCPAGGVTRGSWEYRAGGAPKIEVPEGGHTRLCGVALGPDGEAEGRRSKCPSAVPDPRGREGGAMKRGGAIVVEVEEPCCPSGVDSADEGSGAKGEPTAASNPCRSMRS